MGSLCTVSALALMGGGLGFCLPSAGRGPRSGGQASAGRCRGSGGWPKAPGWVRRCSGAARWQSACRAPRSRTGSQPEGDPWPEPHDRTGSPHPRRTPDAQLGSDGAHTTVAESTRSEMQEQVGMAALEDLRLTTNGVMLHAAAAGPTDGPLVILLHGFPEFWYGWRRQIE